MKKPKDIKLHISSEILNEGKNVNGYLGGKCNNCGGYGFTMKIAGGRLPCNDCTDTGVKEPTNREVQSQISDLRKDLHELKKALLKTLIGHGQDLDAEQVKEAIHV